MRTPPRQVMGVQPTDRDDRGTRDARLSVWSGRQNVKHRKVSPGRRWWHTYRPSGLHRRPSGNGTTCSAEGARTATDVEWLDPILHVDHPHDNAAACLIGRENHGVRPEQRFADLQPASERAGLTERLGEERRAVLAQASNLSEDELHARPLAATDLTVGRLIKHP